MKKVNYTSFQGKSKQKKDFLIISGFIIVIVLVGISIFQYALKVDETKLYKEREISAVTKEEINITPKKNIKEAWAISVENRFQETENKTAQQIKMMQEESKRANKEIADILLENRDSQEKRLFELNKELAEKQESFERMVKESLLTQENKIEEMKAKGGRTIIQGSPAKTDDDIILGEDLLPKLVEKNKKDTNDSEDSLNDPLDDLISEDILEKRPQVKPVKKEVRGAITKKSNKNKGEGTPKIKKKKMFGLFDIDTSDNKKYAIDLKKKELKRLKAKMKVNHSFHIMTGFSEAFLLTGVSAPAFSEGSSDPIPVLLEATGEIMIANDDTETLKGCFFLGSSKGNMNTQTADIRLNKISCSLADGTKKIEGSINGWVVDGKTGKPGLKGDLVHKNGALLARTFVAGFLETFSKSAVSFSGGANSGTETVGSALTASGSESTSEVFSKIGDYYLKMAEQIFPVIEVKPGQTVDIFLQGGDTLTVTDFNSIDIDELESEILSMERDLDSDKSRYNNIKDSLGDDVKDIAPFEEVKEKKKR